MKKILLVVVLLIAVTGGVVYLNQPKLVVTEKVNAHEVYQCPMHPQIVQDHPGNCPICGMKLVKVQSQPDSQTGMPGEKPMSVGRHAVVPLTDDQIKSMGLITEPVSEETLISSLRFNGSVFYNAEILETLVRYRSAVQVQQRYKQPTFERVSQSRAEAVALRNKLRRLGISDEFFKQSEESLNDPTSFVPANVILQASGAYVDARLPINDLVHVRIGQKAKIYSVIAPDSKLEGVVRSVDSVVDPATQTLAVRLEVTSGYEHLKPGMFVSVEMDIDLGKKISVSNEAIFNPGKNAFVFLEKEKGIFVPRKVETGIIAGKRIEILDGLKIGDNVAVSANFLIDSESRFQAARATSNQSGGNNHD